MVHFFIHEVPVCVLAILEAIIPRNRQEEMYFVVGWWMNNIPDLTPIFVLQYAKKKKELVCSVTKCFPHDKIT